MNRWMCKELVLANLAYESFERQWERCWCRQWRWRWCWWWSTAGSKRNSNALTDRHRSLRMLSHMSRNTSLIGWCWSNIGVGNKLNTHVIFLYSLAVKLLGPTKRAIQGFFTACMSLQRACSYVFWRFQWFPTMSPGFSSCQQKKDRRKQR